MLVLKAQAQAQSITTLSMLAKNNMSYITGDIPLTIIEL
jgi:hypothetical protein